MKNNNSLNFLVTGTWQLGLYLALGCSLVSCNTNQKETTGNATATTADSLASTADSSRTAALNLVPKEPKPTWAPEITPPMQVVLEQLASYKTPPLPTLSAPEARQQPSPTTAVLDVMQKNNIPMPPAPVDTTGKSIPVAGGSIHARVYTPKSGAGPFPVIVYYHGGGWVIANLDTYNASAQGLAEQVGAVVVSVAYRQAPEHKFPTAHNDSYAAYQWVLKNAASLQGDPKRVAVVGESAGGNLAAAVSMMAKQKGAMVPLYQVLVYPIAGSDTQTKSYQQYASAKPLDKPLMEWFFKQYLRSPADGNNPMITLTKAPDLKSMPPTTIINAQLDPLLSEGEMLADKLKTAGVAVNQKTFSGVTHEFFGMATVLPEAKEAQAMAAADLKKAFTK
ncbi:lipase [Adhaeribacter arboris]|uniref:Lipase n=1 Tax=Adhaeribacter arboris TaxID=2072846 RepID=A0A2T2YEY5_9BACT|nr:alpha/beta hydrolase [Adhaeribacter arboris]PSR54070.1 lipase [Adhaeribacter arboris]